MSSVDAPAMAKNTDLTFKHRGSCVPAISSPADVKYKYRILNWRASKVSASPLTAASSETLKIVENISKAYESDSSEELLIVSDED